MDPLPLRSFSLVLGIQAVWRRPRRAPRKKSAGTLGTKVPAHVGQADRAEIIGAARRAVALHTALSSGNRARDDGSGFSGGFHPRRVRSDTRSLYRLQFQRLRDSGPARALFSPGRNPAILSVPR